MPYYQLLTDKTILILQDVVATSGANPLQDSNPEIVKTWYLDPALPVFEYRNTRSQIMAEIDALRAPPGSTVPEAQTESPV